MCYQYFLYDVSNTILPFDNALEPVSDFSSFMLQEQAYNPEQAPQP
jgi:hypothetical protein